MKKFSKSSSFRKSDSGRSEGRSFSKPKGESRFGAGRRDAMRSPSRGESFEATCDGCGKTTDLPFKPTGAKPVYCRECFNKDGGSSPSRSFDRNDRPSRDRDYEPRRSNGGNQDAIDKINAKLDKIMKALKIEEK